MYPIDPSSTLTYACAHILSSPSYYIFLRAPKLVCHLSKWREKEREVNRYRDEIIAKLFFTRRYDDVYLLSGLSDGFIVDDRSADRYFFLNRFKDRRDKTRYFVVSLAKINFARKVIKTNVFVIGRIHFSLV